MNQIIRLCADPDQLRRAVIRARSAVCGGAFMPLTSELPAFFRNDPACASDAVNGVDE